MTARVPLDPEAAVRKAAAEVAVDLTAAPSPLPMSALAEACWAKGRDIADLMERAERLMRETLPAFGWLQVERTRGVLVGCLGQHGLDALDDLTPAQLRELAADALKAAEWIEAWS